MHRPFHAGRSALEAAHFAVTFYGLILTLGGILSTCPTAAVVGFLMMFVGLAFFFLNNLFQED